MQAVLSGECETCVFDYPCHAPQERRWFAFRISPLHTAGAPRFLVCHDNVTPQRRAEEQARINEARYQAVFSGVGDAILVSDAHGNHLDANPAAERLLGCTREELLKSSLQELTLPNSVRNGSEQAYLTATGTWRG